MKVYTYSQARQRLAAVLDEARQGGVRIKRRTGDCFEIRLRRESASPFDVPSIQTRASTGDILRSIEDARAR